MSTLSDDLDKDAHDLKEAIDKGQILKGLAIIGRIATEITAVIGLIIGVYQVTMFVTGGLASLGLPIASGVVMAMLRKAIPAIVCEYDSLNTDERKSVRAALKFLGLTPFLK